MSIQLVCPNGHRLTAKESNAGKTGKCPVCQVPVSIPIPSRSVVTADSAIVVAVLGELNAKSASQKVGRTVLAPKRQPAMATKESSVLARTRVCPNCERDIDLGYHICPHCHAYLTGLNEF
jgi:RNA polymerase subunit RPABC4/transcription elongation factor Spt4